MLALFAVLSLILAACGSGTSATTTKVPVTFAVFLPFTGPDSYFGPHGLAGCDAAVQLIDKNGGILGGKATCSPYDTHGDPADAVEAADRMIATTSHLDGAIGPSSDEALATVPIFNQAQIPMFGVTGQAFFDHSPDKYFWRLSLADSLSAKVMALTARQSGYQYAATVFGSDVGGQGVDTPVTAAFTALGGKVVIDLPLTFDETSYRTEIERLLATNPKPQVIFTETDPQTSATFFGEFKELTGGLIPVISEESELDSVFYQATAKAVGPDFWAANFRGVQPFEAPHSTAFTDYVNSMEAAGQSEGLSAATIAGDQTNVNVADYYDATNMMALAMVAAKSTNPSDYNSFIAAVVNPGPGKVVVTSYAEGVTQLQAGHQIQYVGTVGSITFNQWHDSAGSFAVAKYDDAGNIIIQSTITSAAIAKIGS